MTENLSVQELGKDPITNQVRTGKHHVEIIYLMEKDICWVSFTFFPVEPTSFGPFKEYANWLTIDHNFIFTTEYKRLSITGMNMYVLLSILLLLSLLFSSKIFFMASVRRNLFIANISDKAYIKCCCCFLPGEGRGDLGSEQQTSVFTLNSPGINCA